MVIFMENRTLARRLGKGLITHIVDSTALITATNPLLSALEVTVGGMSDDVSINARMTASALAYVGLAYALSKGRDMSKKVFKIVDQTKERVKQLHDAAYLAAFNVVFGPALYLFSGETDANKIAAGTAILVGTGALVGGPVGYSIDTFRELTGIQSSERVPTIIRNKSPTVKRGIAGLLTIASVAAMAGIYAMTSQ